MGSGYPVTSMQVRSRIITAATVIAVAAACCTFIIWMSFGPGIAVAKSAEVWGQRLLPGGYHVEFVEKAWSTPESLNTMGLLAYEERTPEDFWLCLPGIIGTLLVCVLALALHAGFCWLLARRFRHAASSKNDGVILGHAPLSFRAVLCRWSALFAACAPLLVCLLRWIWAGVARGWITQAQVGENIVQVSFGPFGRFAVLLGGFALYAAVVLWTARAIYRRRNAGSKQSLLAPITLTVLAVVLFLFPYWSVQTIRVTGADTFTRVNEWSEKTSIRGILEAIAPLP